MDHSSQYIFINKPVFAKRSTMNFDTIPEPFLWHIWHISVCYVLLVTPRLFFEFTWSEKVLLLKVFFHFSNMSQKKVFSVPDPVLPLKKKSHEIFNLVSSITIFGDSVSSIFDPIIVKSRASSLPCIFKSTSGTFTCNVNPCFFVFLTCLSPDAVALFFCARPDIFLKSSLSTFVRVCIGLDCIYACNMQFSS